MEFLRTANAGGLLKMDGISILLDGVCSKVEPYAVTPEDYIEQLSVNYPDAVGFTHRHPDHFLNSYVCDYERETGKRAYLDEAICVKLGNVHLQSILTRHLGRVEEGLLHCSFLISGTKTVLFTGDAAPATVKGIAADVVIAPFAYANSSSGLKAVLETGAKYLILVHMPECKADPYGIWAGVNETILAQDGLQVFIPEMGENIVIH